MAKILIAEDERPISELVKRNLMLVGHTAAQAFDGPCALEMAGAERFDLVLLDVMLPGCSGFEVKEQLDPALPVIFVTAKNNLSSRLQGLGLGADDYIVKPFEILELLARVEAVLRRVHAGAEVFDLGDCHVEFGTHRVFVAGREVALTPQEFMLLGVLVRNRNLALSRKSCCNWPGATIMRETPEPWTYIFRSCAKSWALKIVSRRCTSSATG